jgi:hypothetical protein
LRPAFAEQDAAPPLALRTIYASFAEDDAMLALLVATRLGGQLSLRPARLTGSRR